MINTLSLSLCLVLDGNEVVIYIYIYIFSFSYSILGHPQALYEESRRLVCFLSWRNGEELSVTTHERLPCDCP